VAHKFISEEEWQSIDPDTRFEQMYLVWCCKEALYKYYGKKNLAFKEHLALKTFSWSPEGSLIGIIQKDDYYIELPVYWKTIDNYLLAWVSG
jgi:4'-phosphopantetheinyl transferase